MDFLVLLYGLLISSGALIYILLIFKLAMWAEKINGYVSFFIWMMGVVGIPVSIAFGLFGI